jgi:hypothetical protein
MMRAKMQVHSVEKPYEGAETLRFGAVTGTEPFGPKGESEDNTYARYTPQADLSMTVTNPDLLGKFKQGDKFYVDFTPAT